MLFERIRENRIYALNDIIDILYQLEHKRLADKCRDKGDQSFFAFC